MRITREMTIAGVPAITLRDVLRRYGDASWGIESLAKNLDVPNEEASKITSSLLDEGFIEVERDGEPNYITTTKGNALANASAAKPISRKTAERLVRDVIERAVIVNATPHFAHYVTKIQVFGSYLTDRPDLGDIDIAVGLTRKFEGDEHTNAIFRYADMQQADGRRFPSFFARLACAEGDIYKTLRGSSRAISIHQASELSELQVTDSEIIYRYP